MPPIHVMSDDERAMFVAVNCMNQPKISELLDVHPELANACSSSGLRPLMRACMNKDAPAVAMLLEKGADVNAAQEDGITALHYAVKNASVECAQVLLGAGADVNIRDSAGMTPLDQALRDEASTGMLAALSAKEMNGAKPLSKKWGRFSGKERRIIARMRDYKIPMPDIMDFMSSGAHEALGGTHKAGSPLVEAIAAKDYLLLERLLELGFDPDDAGLHLMSKDESTRGLRGKRGKFAVAMEESESRSDILLKEEEAYKKLLDQVRRDMRDSGEWTPLACALSFRDLKAAEILISHGAPSDAEATQMIRRLRARESADETHDCGEHVTNDKDGTILTLIPGGEFLAGGGSSNACTDVFSTNLPGYYIGKYPVTNRQFQGFLDETGYSHARRTARTDQETARDLPVVNVSWEDANAYCRWAGLRLPTELEWEKAARGTDGRLFPWGNAWEYGWCCHWHRCALAQGPCSVYENAEGRSPYGICHMAGNVWEWCNDSYDAEAYGRYRGGDIAPPRFVYIGNMDVCEQEILENGKKSRFVIHKKPCYGAGGPKVVRGGSWRFWRSPLRNHEAWDGPQSRYMCACRGHRMRRVVSDAVGFRCAKDV